MSEASTPNASAISDGVYPCWTRSSALAGSTANLRSLGPPSFDADDWERAESVTTIDSIGLEPLSRKC